MSPTRPGPGTPGSSPGRVFRDAALRAHLDGRASSAPAMDEAGPGRALLALWAVAAVLVVLAAVAVA